MQTVAEDFCYDVTPIAFNIKLQLPPGVVFAQGYGSSELAALSPGSSAASLSSEFPSPVNGDGTVIGGLVFFRLAEATKATNATKATKAAKVGERVELQPLAGDVRTLEVAVSWEDTAGHSHARTLRVEVPSAAAAAAAAAAVPASASLLSLRKGVALSHYVDLLTSYATADESKGDGDDEDGGVGGGGGDDDDGDDDDDDDDDSGPNARFGREEDSPKRLEACSEALCLALRAASIPQLLALPCLSALIDRSINASIMSAGSGVSAEAVPAKLRKAHAHGHQFTCMSKHLSTELAACGDLTLGCGESPHAYAQHSHAAYAQKPLAQHIPSPPSSISCS